VTDSSSGHWLIGESRNDVQVGVEDFLSRIGAAIPSHVVSRWGQFTIEACLCPGKKLEGGGPLIARQLEGVPSVRVWDDHPRTHEDRVTSRKKQAERVRVRDQTLVQLGRAERADIGMAKRHESIMPQVLGESKMRKQYHFWPSAEGLQAWDVHRLIELSKGLPRNRVALGSIREIDEVYWFDDAKQRPTCRNVLEHMKLIEEADLAHPIILGADGRVMDGMHRVAKAVLAGDTEIEGVRFEVDPEPDHVGRRPEDLPY